MLLTGLLTLVLGALSRVLHRHGRRDDDDLAQTARLCPFDDHPPKPRVDRKPGEVTTNVGEPAFGLGMVWVDGVELLEQCNTISNVAQLGRLDERKPFHVAQTERRHLQNHRREVRARYLRFGELRTGVEVLLRVEPDGDAIGHTSATAAALIR